MGRYGCKHMKNNGKYSAGNKDALRRDMKKKEIINNRNKKNEKKIISMVAIK